MKKVDPKVVKIAIAILFILAGALAVAGFVKLKKKMDLNVRPSSGRTIKDILPGQFTKILHNMKDRPGEAPREPESRMMEPAAVRPERLPPPSEIVMADLSEESQRRLAELYNAGMTAFLNNDTASAVTAFQGILAIDAQGRYGQFAFIQLGIIFDEAGRHQEAVKNLRNATILDPQDAIAHHDLGLALLHAGKTGESIETLRKAVSLDRSNPTIFQNLGNAYSLAGRPAEAIAAFRNALSLDPNLGPVLFNLGLVNYHIRNFGEAEKNFGLAVSNLEGRNKARAEAFLGITQFERGSLPEAAESFGRAAANDSAATDYRFNEAVVYGILASKSEAVRAYRSVLARTPSDSIAWFGLGGILYMQGDTVAAMEAYGRGLLLDPSATGPLFTLGFLLYEKGDMEGAEQTFREVIRLGGPDAPRAHVNLGLCLEAKGLLADAAKAYESGDQSDPRTHYNLGLVRRKLGQMDEAIKSLAMAQSLAEKKRPTETQYPIALADAYLAAGRPDAAVTSYERAIKIGGERFDLLIRIARITTRLERLTEASNWVYRALNAAQTPQERALAMLAEGLVHDRRGDIPAALSSMDKALAADRLNPDIYYNLGILFARQLRYDESVEALRAAIRLNPGYSPAFTQLGNVYYSRGIKDEAAKAYAEAVKIDSGNVEAVYNLKMLKGK